MTSLSQFDQELLRRLNLHQGGYVAVAIQNVEGWTDRAKRYARRRLLEMESQDLIEGTVYDANTGKWESWRRYRRRETVFSINRGDISIKLTAKGEEYCDHLGKRFGFAPTT